MSQGGFMSKAVSTDNFQVILTGRRLDSAGDAELSYRLQTQFRLGAGQAAQLLSGRRVIKRAVDLQEAARLAGLLRRCGLESAVEAMPSPAQGAVPSPTPVAPRPPPVAPAQTTPAQLLESLAAQSLAAPPLDPRERRQLAVVTAASLMLPTAYFALAASVAWSWLWYLTHVHLQVGTLALGAQVIAYLLPGVAGAALCFLLFKPLLPRRADKPAFVTLDATAEPEFRRGVNALCSALGVSPPAQIRLDCSVGAELQYRDPWRGLGNGHTVLRLGLPLLAALSARELVGVLAHRFGHAAQPDRMRAAVLLQRSQDWLEDRAYTLDAWDERLEDWHERSEIAVVRALAMVAALGQQLVRALLAGLLRLSLLLSRHGSRQIEAEADRLEALVAGSSQFRLTARNLRALAQAADEIEAANAGAWQEGRLLQDLPAAIAAQYQAMDAERLRAIDAEMAQGAAAYGDPHAADAARIAAVLEQNAPGLFLSDQPARGFLQQYEAWCQQVTQASYAARGMAWTLEQLQTREAILGLQQTRSTEQDILDRFFNGQLRPWPLIDLTPPASAALNELGWQGVIDRLRQASPEMTQDWLAAEELEQRRPALQLSAALALKPSRFGLRGLDALSREELWRQLEEIRARSSSAHQQWREDLGLHAYRIACARQALSGEGRAQADALHELLLGLHQLEAAVAGVAELGSVCLTLRRIAAAGGHPDAETELQDALRHFAGHARQLLEGSARLPQRLVPGATVADYLLARCPQAALERIGDQQRYLQDAEGLPEAFQKFYQLALSQLALLCEGAERARGIVPIRRVARAA